MKRLLFVVIALISIKAAAQQGTIRGTVVEDESGETLIGVNVLVKGTNDKGTVTDLDGEFSLQLDPGTYDLQVSYITYQTMTIVKVEVKPEEVTQLQDIRMVQSNMELGEVVISAEMARTSEAAMMTIKKKSAATMDGISSARMQLTGDATAVEAAKRVTGVTIEGGKYIYIRGLGDRYSKTTLNGVDIPGLDPDKNTIQMDIFPSNLIDNIMVTKNFTADLPADFTGGILNVETKAFPESKILSVSAGVSYNPSMHFNENSLTYDGGATDFLGFDDGTRALPERARLQNVPTPINGDSDEEVNQFVRSFDPQLGAKRQMSFMDYSLGFNLADQIELKPKSNDSYSPKLGYIFSLSYKAENRYYDDFINAEYQRTLSSPDIYELQYSDIFTGQVGEQNVLVGALGGLAYKGQHNKYRLTAMRLQSGERRTGQFNLDNNGQAVGQSGYIAGSDNLEYNERSLTNILLNGTHILPVSGWEIDWRISPTISTSDDPDIRKTAFTQTAVDTSFIAGAGGNPSRIWRELDETSATAKVDLTKDFKAMGRDAKLKFGGLYTYKVRNYEILFFDVQFFGSQNWPNPVPSAVLDPENIFPNSPNNLYYQSGNNDPNPNAYESNVNSTAAYVSTELSPLPNLKTILGLRMENYVQRHTGRDQRYSQGDEVNGRNLDNEKVLDAMDLFPSAIFIYALNENQNLRASYSRTIARPSFKELSFAQILDPITNRIFNGSLFPYPEWNGELTETRIDNFDVRWELFQERGQLLSASGFYKKFDNPIELVRIPAQQTSTEFQPRNVGQGQLYGIELEFRKSLEFITPTLSNFNVSGNITFVYSEIDMTDTEFNGRKNFERTGETIERTRDMQGQSPYVINAGLGYTDTDLGLDAGLFYNVKGPTLFLVSSGLYPDVYSEPFHSLNFSINKQLGKDNKTSVDFRVSNILDDRQEMFFQSFRAENQPFSGFNPGISFSLGVSHNF
ncbi:MAG: TonB-dependent receptor domain-containing protein [Cryomorphaceae bacterium]